MFRQTEYDLRYQNATWFALVSVDHLRKPLAKQHTKKYKGMQNVAGSDVGDKDHIKWR